MSSSWRRDLDDFAKRGGWTMEIAGSGHFKLRHIETGAVVFTAATPHNAWRTMRNMERDAKHAVRAAIERRKCVAV